MKVASFWHALPSGLVQCDLCPHACVLAEGRVGRCMVRGVRGGSLAAQGYGRVASGGVDPIEKKPLYHFRPGTEIFSIGGWGCNFSCRFCQNWSISQAFDPTNRTRTAEDVVRRALAAGSASIAYTYNEPLIGIEFVMDCAQRARENGLANVLVTNGYIRGEPASELLPLIDAVNIDIKSMDPDFYKRYCGGRLEPVQDFAVQCAGSGVHVEITNLLIPGLNVESTLQHKLAAWVRDHLGCGTPLHLSAYRPQHKMTIQATPTSVLEEAYSVCREVLPYVYMGNVVTATGQDTLCPGCGSTLIRRRGYDTCMERLSGGACNVCGRAADMVL